MIKLKTNWDFNFINNGLTIIMLMPTTGYQCTFFGFQGIHTINQPKRLGKTIRCAVVRPDLHSDWGPQSLEYKPHHEGKEERKEKYTTKNNNNLHCWFVFIIVNDCTNRVQKNVVLMTTNKMDLQLDILTECPTKRGPG